MTIKIESQDTDEIIKGCLKSDKKSQRQLYEMFAPLMLSVCRRYICDFDSAQDVMIKAFMVVFDKLSQFRHEGSFEGWVRRIMVNESLTWLRKNKSMYLEVEIESADKEIDFEVVSAQLNVEDLMALVYGLPSGYRTVFNLYAIEGYSHAEVAKQLGINVNTSKSQLSRARVLLQKKLAELEKIADPKKIENGK
ncbi:RNA polymerase sigma factor [Reichenbachiella sp. MALMAid0571]|uniref:RNA polymerase sigma factor n=1 Tax=Reichenbachiella sp. MALMAid0571 TaxID=3143939 RepID=UPI0032E03AE1